MNRRPARVRIRASYTHPAPHANAARYLLIGRIEKRRHRQQVQQARVTAVLACAVNRAVSSLEHNETCSLVSTRGNTVHTTYSHACMPLQTSQTRFRKQCHGTAHIHEHLQTPGQHPRQRTDKQTTQVSRKGHSKASSNCNPHQIHRIGIRVGEEQRFH